MIRQSSRGRLRPATERRCHRPIARRDPSRRSGRRGGARRFRSDGCVPVERRERGPDQFSNDAAVESLSRRSNGGELFDHEERAIEGYFTTAGARTLDLGCGAGRVTSALADRGLDVTGVDRSGTQLRSARALLPSVPIVESDAANLPFPTDAFRYVVFAYNGLDYLIPRESREAALREVRRVIDPSGVFLFSSHNLWYTLPALVLDRKHVVDKFLRTRNRDRLFDRYKYEEAAAGDLDPFFSDPHVVRRELRNAGFELVEIVGNRRFPASLLEWSPYCVAAPVCRTASDRRTHPRTDASRGNDQSLRNGSSWENGPSRGTGPSRGIDASRWTDALRELGARRVYGASGARVRRRRSVDPQPVHRREPPVTDRALDGPFAEGGTPLELVRAADVTTLRAAADERWNHV